MIIYIDVVFIINFILDLALLLTVNIALKRYRQIRYMLLSSLIGEVSLINLFIPLNSALLCLFKLIIALIMVITAFGYKNIKYTFYNALYFYMTSIILGGFLYFLKLEFSYKNDNIIFYYGSLGLNYLFLIILSPIILYVFIKSLKALKEIKNYYYSVLIMFDKTNKLKLTGFLDTGNRLTSPISNKPIILINKKLLKSEINIRSPMYIPYNTVSGHSLLLVIKPYKIYINKKEIKNYLIGLTEDSFNLNGIECLLNYKILEDIC